MRRSRYTPERCSIAITVSARRSSPMRRITWHFSGHSANLGMRKSRWLGVPAGRAVTSQPVAVPALQAPSAKGRLVVKQAAGGGSHPSPRRRGSGPVVAPDGR